MGFTVTFYNFEKRNNSTKRPGSDVTQTSYTCRVLNGTGIINPKIELDIGLTGNPQAFNYCYIPDFERYYFIREWNFDRGLWIGSLTVDVLATYKTEIGASNLYVLRAAGAYDGNVIDNFYPCKTNCDYDKSVITKPYEPYYSGTGFGGCYILGVVNENASYGSIRYYAIEAPTLATVCDYLIKDAVSEANGFSWDDATMALQSSLIDPIQYIKSAIWLPFSRTDLNITIASVNIKVYRWSIPNASGYPLVNPYASKSFTIPLKKHPDTQSRGNYVNTKPYTNITLAFPPFGVIDIDTSVVNNATNLNLELYIDPITGKGILEIKANNIILNRLEAQIGVPIQLSQIKSDYLGAANSIIGGAAGAIGSFALGGAAGIAGGIAGIAGSIGNAVEALTPKAQTIGSGGSFSHLEGPCEIDYQFFRPVDDDPAHNGRPLCQKRVLSTLSGYMLIQDGDVITDGTSTEADQIRNYLESGFYYE